MDTGEDMVEKCRGDIRYYNILPMSRLSGLQRWSRGQGLELAAETCLAQLRQVLYHNVMYCTIMYCNIMYCTVL